MNETKKEVEVINAVSVLMQVGDGRSNAFGNMLWRSGAVWAVANRINTLAEQYGTSFDEEFKQYSEFEFAELLVKAEGGRAKILYRQNKETKEWTEWYVVTKTGVN